MSKLNAVQDMLSVHAHYAQRGLGLAQAALAGSPRFVRWAHYPHNDVDDVAHGSRFFYHAHEPDEMLPNEHGHFHVFARTGNQRTKHNARDAHRYAHLYAHLIGVSIDARGTPLRLFTTNQWVTGEDWAHASDVSRVLQRFQLQTAGRLAPVARWLNGLVQFYAESIQRLLNERDARLQKHAQRHRQTLAQAHADRRLHITSQQHLPHHWQHMQQESQP